jgi:hypothetical protein
VGRHLAGRRADPSCPWAVMLPGAENDRETQGSADRCRGRGKSAAEAARWPGYDQQTRSTGGRRDRFVGRRKRGPESRRRRRPAGRTGGRPAPVDGGTAGRTVVRPAPVRGGPAGRRVPSVRPGAGLPGLAWWPGPAMERTAAGSAARMPDSRRSAVAHSRHGPDPSLAAPAGARPARRRLARQRETERAPEGKPPPAPAWRPHQRAAGRPAPHRTAGPSGQSRMSRDVPFRAACV